MSEARTVWIVGATGLVGREALAALLEEPGFAKVVAIVRRTTGIEHPRLEELSVDFESLSRQLADKRADVAVCCLGTTIKQAGSQRQFRHVDFDYPLAFAQSALSAGAKHFIVVTALGADPKSRIFYNRVKGELEEALSGFGFASLTILRPSLLLGDRKETRLGEKLGAPFSKLLPKSLRGIDVARIGRAIARFAREPGNGKRVVLSKELQDF